jgi:cytochrome d ubiquinol oxidase subunit II
VIGALAAGNVPPGNAQGDILSSWLAPVPIMVGVLLVATSAYLAAVYLAADAERRGEDDLAEAFGQRALGAGLLAGLLAIAGLVVLYFDARPFFDAMASTNGHDNELGRICVLASAIAGTATLWLVTSGRYGAARYVAAVAVAAIVVGWGLAQQPEVLPGLTIHEAAASDEVIIGLLIAVAIGLLVLIPSLYLLYSLVLGGRFDPLDVPPPDGGESGRPLEPVGRVRVGLVSALALVGGLMLFTSDAGVTLYLGLALFLAALASGVVLLARGLVRVRD